MDQNAKNKNGHATIPPCCLKAQVLLNWKPIVLVLLFQDGSLSIRIHLVIIFFTSLHTFVMLVS
ncbi:hypothetical protein Hdeb2414_s0101g00793621 [Helianthus debilis subsp. tardiflorus]